MKVSPPRKVFSTDVQNGEYYNVRRANAMRRAPLDPEDIFFAFSGGELAGLYSPSSTPIIEVRSEKLGGHLSTALFPNWLVYHDCPPFSSKKFRLNFPLLLFLLQHPFLIITGERFFYARVII